nr:zinc finger, CCHC-type [Tanacetum cinerariifolium]
LFALKLEELECKVEVFGWSRLTWSKRERCGHFKDQEMDCGACKQILVEGDRVVIGSCVNTFTLEMQVTLHNKIIVMQVTLHNAIIVMQVTLHNKITVMQVTLHNEIIVMQVTLHNEIIVMQVTLHYELIVMQVTLHYKFKAKISPRKSGLNHNLFSVGQFCDADLEVAFQKSTCFVRDLQGNDLLTGNRGLISMQFPFKNRHHQLHSVSWLKPYWKLVHLEQPMTPLPYPVASQGMRDAYEALNDAQNEVACLMLGSMSPELQMTLKNYKAYDMIQELKSMFVEQAKQERFKRIKAFYTCKHKDGQSLSCYLLKMKRYLDTLECLGYAMPNEFGVSLILNSLNKDYDQFVQNYNMHNMGKTLVEIHAMLKLYEKGIPKKDETLVVLAIHEGKIQKDSKKPQGAKGKAKGKNKLTYAPKTKISPSPKRDNLAKDSIFHHCKEVGHWKRNCPSYHVELKKIKNASVASTSGIFTIELYDFLIILRCIIRVVELIFVVLPRDLKEA